MDENMVSAAELSRRANIMYEFVERILTYECIKREYSPGDVLNMTEIHMLDYIDHNPGITVSELSVSYRKSKGFVSRTVNMFSDKGYIVKMPDAVDSKKKLLFLSVQGKRLCEAHAQYDDASRMRLYHILRRTCSPEEIDAFYKVMDAYVQHLRRTQDHLAIKSEDSSGLPPKE